MSRKNRFVLLEYLSLGFSLFGIAVAGFTQQFLYAVVPLCLNMPIGLIRRQQLEQKLNDISHKLLVSSTDRDLITQIEEKITEIEQVSDQSFKQVFNQFTQIESELKNTNESFSVLSEPLNQRINDVSEKFTALESGMLIENRTDSTEVQDPQILEQLRTQISTIIKTTPSPESIHSLIQAEINKSIKEKFQIIQEIFPQNYSYDLVCGRKESRQVLFQALQTAQERIIIVCPWLANYAIDATVKKLIVTALRREIFIDIGWGHLHDVDNDPRAVSTENFLKSQTKGRYGAVKWLLQTAQQFPRLRLKPLGTHEKYLVCDHQFLMVGSHNFMTSGDKYPERELGIKTDNPQVVQKIIKIYDNLPFESVHTPELWPRQTPQPLQSKISKSPDT